MSRAHHQRVMEIFRGVVDLGADAREAYLDDACGSDATLRAEVESMLDYDTGTGLFDDEGLAAGRAIIEATSIEASLPLPERIGQYRPTRVLGRGGMGVVYEAQQEAPRRRVALKMIRPGAMSREHLRRFRLEAEVLGRLRHPGIAQIYESGTIDSGEGGQPFFAMELVEGQPITAYVKTHALDTNQRLELCGQVCDAVQHAHQKGVVHRDLKPDNILVDARGHARILDFGVARATDADVQVTTIRTDAGAMIGTVPYMSPEQVTGRTDSVDTRSDVYALGVVVFELLADRLPHDLRGLSILESARIISQDDPTRLGSVASMFRGDLDAIVGKALAKEPERRYQSAAELGAEIRRYLASEPITARPPTTLYQLRRFARRNRAIVAGTGIAFIALVVGLVVAVLFAIDARERATEAQWATYRSQLVAAAAALRDGEVVAARDGIDAMSTDRAGWEAEYLHARLDSAIRERSCVEGQRWLSPHWLVDTGPRAVLLNGQHASVVNAFDGSVIAEWTTETEVTGARLSADGARLVAWEPAASAFRIWNVDGSDRWTVDVPPAEDGIGHFALDHSGTRIAYRMWQTPDRVSVVDVETQASLLEYQGKWNSQPFFSHAGTRLAITDNASLSIVDTETGETLVRVAIDGVGLMPCAWSPDDELLAIGMKTRRSVRVVRTDTLETILQTPRLRTNPGLPVFSPDGQIIAVPRELAIDLWDVEQAQRIGSIWGPANGVAFEPSGSRLLAVGGTTLRLVDRAAASLPTFEDSTFLYLVAFSPDGSLLATGGFSGKVQVWDVLERTLVTSFETARTIITSLSFTGDGRRLLARTCRRSDRSGSRLESWDVTTGESRVEDSGGFWPDELRPGASSAVITSGVGCVKSRDGTRVVIGRSRAIEVIDATTREVLFVIPSWTRATGISLDNRLIATQVEAGVQLWDGLDGTPVRTLHAPSGELIYGIAFTLDGTRVVGAGRSGSIHFWHVETGDLICSFELHDDYVHHVHFSDDGTRLATASGDGTAKVLDTISYADRDHERGASRVRRLKMRPVVAAWRADRIDKATIAERLHADHTLTSADRCALFDG